MLFFIIINVNLIYALSSDMPREYSKKETAIVKISGNILEPIDLKKVTFLRNHVEIPLIYDLKLINGSYYLWFIAPENENNYTLFIKDVTTSIKGNIEKIDFRQNFSVGTNLTDYNIGPGFIIAKEDFEVKVNLFEDNDKIIEVENFDNKDFNLKPGENNIKFDISEFKEEGLTLIKIGKYALPVYAILDKPILIKKSKGLILMPGEIRRIHLISEKKIFYQIELYNSADKEIKDLQISVNKELFEIKPDKKIDIKSGDRAYFNLTLKKNIREGVYEQLFIQSELNNISLNLPVMINFTENISDFIAAKNITKNEINNSGNLGFYCSELDGKLCSGGEKCSGENFDSIDGKCCIGICGGEPSGNSWIGYLMAFIALIILIYIYYRYKNVKAGKSIIEKKTSLDNKRVP